MRIGQRIKQEKIGTLSHGAGIISLQPSILNIGGLQVETDSLSRTISTDVTLIANTLYMIYVVLNSGVPEIRISTNVNSVGPAGFNSWKLVGAFLSNGVTGSIAFGSFVNIEGTPKSNSSVPFTTTWTGAISNPVLGNANLIARYNLEADSIEGWINLDMGSTTTYGSGTWQFSSPTNMTVDNTKIASGLPGTAVGDLYCSNGSVANNAGVAVWNSTSIVGWLNANANNLNPSQPFVWTNGNSIRINFILPISGFSNTPLKDR